MSNVSRESLISFLKTQYLHLVGQKVKYHPVAFHRNSFSYFGELIKI